MRKKSVIELLDYASEQIIELENKIKTGSVDRVLIKNVLENLRSALDYVAHDISDKLSSPNSRVYFPYAKNLNEFERSVKRNLPNLDKEFPDIYNIIKSIQPFESSSNWLILVCGLVNAAKHHNLNEIEEKDIIHGFMGGGMHLSNVGSFNIKNAKLNGLNIKSIVVKEGELEELILDNFSELVFLKKSLVTFLGEEHEICEFLKYGHSNIKKISNDIYNFI
ncbi:hypothetical protein [Dokdonia pacifica]|nr:hypothetical protein [Dokdonia pacifica]